MPLHPRPVRSAVQGHHVACLLKGNVKWHEAVQSKVKRWTLGLFLLSLAVSLFWVFKVCIRLTHARL